MNIQTFSNKFTFPRFCIFLMLFTPLFSWSDPQSDADELAKMQAQLNNEVMAKPFLAEKPEEVDAYIKSMLEKNVKPAEYSGQNWRPGYTCRDLLRYNWREYRNCRYYYRYYGRYY